MPKPESPKGTPQFMVVTYDMHARVDAAALFQSEQQVAYSEAKKRSARVGSKNFQVYAIKVENGALKFSRIEKPKSGG